MGDVGRRRCGLQGGGGWRDDRLRQMALPRWFDDELCLKAIQLVASAHREEQATEDVLYHALSNLDTSTLTAEKTLVDRVKNDREKTGLVLIGPPLLQRLLFKYSDLHAQAEGPLECRNAEEFMLARYLQVLLLFCLHRSSRWMAIGIGQFVFSYSGREVANMTGTIIVKDWAHRERTRAKGKLMEHLASRFPSLIPAPDSDPERKHFEPAPLQDRLISLLETYLDLYTPWCTPHVLRSTDDLRKGIVPEALKERHGSALEGDQTELNRFHVFVDPTCFTFLLKALGCDDWPFKMRLPALCYSERNDQSEDKYPHADNRDLIVRIREKLRRDAIRRLDANKGDLRVYVDKSLVGMIDAAKGTVICTLPTDADVVSVCARDSEGEILLASHILHHSDEGVALPSSGTVRVGRRHRFTFQVSRDLRNSEAATCTVEHSALGFLTWNFFSTQPAPSHHARQVTPSTWVSRWAITTASLIIATLSVWVYQANRGPAIFDILVTPESVIARSTRRDVQPASADLISVPSGTRRVRFEVHSRSLRSGRCLVVLKVDNAVIETTSADLVNGIFYLEVPAARLKTGTYSIDISPVGTLGEASNIETYRFQILSPG